MDKKEPLVSLLYQSTKLFNDLKAAERKRLKDEAQQNMMNRNNQVKNIQRNRSRRG